MDGFDWHGGTITRATPVTPSYRSTQNVRHFLRSQWGAGFKFDRAFMRWVKNGTAKTTAKSPMNGSGETERRENRRQPRLAGRLSSRRRRKRK